MSMTTFNIFVCYINHSIKYKTRKKEGKGQYMKNFRGHLWLPDIGIGELIIY